ncbi:MAG: hypothetical protein NE327_05220 [Lentisphaeraceae bacterium]|nr:hypothetical protein [Lentisphaeraceae bacterium]
MRVLVNGMIAGMHDREYIENAVSLGKKDKLKIDSFNLIDRLENSGNKTLAKLLGTTNYLFEVLREREYAKIGFELQKNKSKNAIIRVPATIEWNHVNFKLKDHKSIAEFIQPDVIVTLIDAEWCIRHNLATMKPVDQFQKTIQRENFSIREILSWMNEEVSLAEDWAKHLGVRHFVIPIGQGAESLYKLVKYANLPSYYVSYSMTHSDPNIRKEINRTIDRLNDYGLVIDPQAIEIGDNYETEKDRLATFAYTVHRDLHWFVGKVDSIIAIHPYSDRPPLSTGMMDELGHARDYLKRRYMIFPQPKQSPFTTDSYIDKGRIVSTPEELFICLEAEGFQKLE